MLIASSVRVNWNTKLYLIKTAYCLVAWLLLLLLLLMLILMLIQETQLSLTNCSTRLEVSQGHQTWYHSIWPFLLVCCSNFVRKMHHFLDIRLQKCCDLENRVMGPSRSLKMSPFNREPMTYYWCSIVIMALSRVVSEIFNVQKYCDLDIPVICESRSSKVVPFDHLIDWLWFPISIL